MSSRRPSLCPSLGIQPNILLQLMKTEFSSPHVYVHCVCGCVCVRMCLCVHFCFLLLQLLFSPSQPRYFCCRPRVVPPLFPPWSREGMARAGGRGAGREHPRGERAGVAPDGRQSGPAGHVLDRGVSSNFPTCTYLRLS